MNPKSCLQKAALSLAALFITINSSPAQTTKIWSGGAGNNYWKSGFNWVDTAAPEPGTETELVFTGGTRPEPYNDFDAGSPFMSLIQDANATTGFTLKGNAISLARGITNHSSHPFNVALSSITASGGLELSASGGDMIISNSSTLNLGESGSMMVRAAPGHTIWFKTKVEVGGDSLASGGELRLLDGGRVVLSEANIYRDTTVSAGTLQVGDGVDTGTLGSGVVNLVSSSSRLAFKPSGTVVVNNEVKGSGSVSVEGPGSVILEGSRSYSVPTTVSGGTLVLLREGSYGSAQTTVNESAVLRIGPAFFTSAGWSLAMNGGTLDLAGVYNTVWLSSLNGSGIIQNTFRDGAFERSFIKVDAGSFNGTIEPAATGQRTILEKAGSGTFTFTGVANGDVQIPGGTLVLSGTVNGTVENRSKLSIGGDTIATLRVSSGLTSASGVELIMNVSSDGLCDKIIVEKNSFICGGKLVIRPIGTLSSGAVFDLVDATSIEPGFTFELPAPAADQEWITSNFSTEGKLILNTRPRTITLSKNRAKGLSLKIPVSEFCTDPDIGDTLSFDSVASSYPGQCTVTISDGMLFYTPVAGFNSADTLEYSVTDSHGFQSTGTIQIQVVSPTTRIENIEEVGDQLVLRLNGIPGFTYRIEQSASADFASHSTVHEFITPAKGAYEWSTAKPTTGSAYFRMRWVP